MRKTRETATELEKRVDKLERTINILAAINPEMVRKADKMLKDLGYTMTGKQQFGKMTFSEKLDAIVKQRERRQVEEYDKLIENNNNNNSH